MKKRNFLGIAGLLLLICPNVSGQEDKSHTLFTIYQAGKCGYIDKTGKVVIRPRFEICGGFGRDLAWVMIKNRKVGFIDRTGRFVIEPKFDWPFSEGFIDGLAAIRIKEQLGYVDPSGNVTLLPEYSYVGHFSDGLARVEQNGLTGFIDKEFDVVIKPRFRNFTQDFSDGLAKVHDVDGSSYYIDKSGRKALDRDGSAFAEGLAFVEVNGKYGFIDKAGKIVIIPQFEKAEFFSEGLAPVRLKGKWGFIDKTGRVVIELRFDKVDSFSSDGLAPVGIGNKHGFINRQGEIVIGLEFDDTDLFDDGLGGIKVGNKWGYVDASGKIIWQPSE